MNLKTLISEIGTRPLTVEERSTIANVWHSLSVTDQLEIAARCRGVSKSENVDIRRLFLETFDILIDFNHRYGHDN